jgi:LacI family transcriptional regulator
MDMALAAPPVYRAIKAELAQFIRHRCEPGARLPSIQDLSRKLRTGQRNTYRAVRELADEGFLVCRPGSGTYVTEQFRSGWQDDDPFASAMDVTRPPERPLTGRRICLLANTRPDPFLRPAVQALSTGLAARGAFVYEQLPGSTDPTAPDLDGATLTPDAVIHVQPDINTALRCRDDQVMAVLSTSSSLRVDPRLRYDLISIDEEQGGMLAGQRLLDAGCRRPCFLGVLNPATQTRKREYDAVSRRRLSGFEHGLGRPLTAAQKLASPFYNSGMAARLAQAFARMPDRPDAVFCASDELAVGFLLGCLALGLEPGADLKIIGFDGQQSGRAVAEGPLTTVDLPIVEMGMKAVEMLTSRLINPEQAPRRLLLGCSLFEGQTVAPDHLQLKARRFAQLQSQHIHLTAP